MAVNRIHRLPSIVIDRIAAGEVIEGPSSVIKELLENALDAGANSLRIETRGAGLEEIVIQDNGEGISFDDLPVSIERHATSKIADIEDIERILSFGFRGEALASIASVSLLSIQSSTKDESVGGFVESRAGTMTRHERKVGPIGTTIRVADIFFAVPARKKFVKSEKTENLKILKEVRRIALAHPGVSIQYNRDGEDYLHYPAAEDERERLGQIFPSEPKDRWLEVEGRADHISLRGFISPPDAVRSNREGQFAFVNGRCIEFKYLSFLLKRAYGDLIPHGLHPSAVLHFKIDPAFLDVNVHPAKKEIRFLDEGSVNSVTIRAVQKALSAGPVTFSDRILSRNFHEVEPVRPLDAEPSFLVGPSLSVSRQSQETVFDADRFAPATRQAGHAPAQGPGRDEFPSRLRQMGVVLGTYIVAEAEDGLYLIDQHTAHERVHYERKRRQLEHMKNQRQPLLHAAVVRLPPDEMQAVLNHGSELESAGFLVEQMGKDACAVREVPFYIDPGTESETLRFVIQRILDGETTVRIFDEYTAMKACKASIKRNDAVPPEVLSHILADLMQCEDPTRCPHGRPTMVKISRDALDRLFMRS